MTRRTGGGNQVSSAPSDSAPERGRALMWKPGFHTLKAIGPGAMIQVRCGETAIQNEGRLPLTGVDR